MKAPSNYYDVPAQFGGNFRQPEAGGYILRCVIIEESISRSDNPMLVFHFDIAEGEFDGYYQKMKESVSRRAFFTEIPAAFSTSWNKI